MLTFTRVLDRVRPQASLAIALVFSIAWIALLITGSSDWCGNHVATFHAGSL
jgi:hypothetical protein